MLIPYALAIGCTLALFGLFCEMAQHFNWTRRQKRWGGLLVSIGAMGVVPFMAEQMNQLAMAATCACLVLALSIRNNQGVVREQVVATEPISGLTFAFETVEERLEPQAQAARQALATAERETAEDVESIEEAEAIEEVVAVEEAVAIEAVVAVEEAETIEAVVAVEEAETIEEAAVVEVAVSYDDTDLEEEEVPAENLGAWLNAKIASAYEAKAGGAFELAYRSFKQAVMRTDDAELSAMLQEEMADCSRHFTQAGQDKLLQAS